jgi:hypothetical protein
MGVAVVGGVVLVCAGPLAQAQSQVQTQSQTQSGRARQGLRQILVEPGITGIIRDASGFPQVGALVELLAPNLSVVAHTFTDDRGRYALPRVSAGTYEVKASGSLFLPTLRENLHLLASSKLVVNLTLNTLFQALQWLPAEPRSADEPKDDWNWTLRLATNRPLLRVLEDDNGSTPVVLVSEGSRGTMPDHRVTIRNGSNRLGESGMHQDVEVERDHDDAHQLILRADLGQSDTATMQSTLAYLRQLTPGTAMVSVASFSDHPEIVGGGGTGTLGGLQVFTLRSASTMTLGPGLEAEAGSELQAARMGNTVAASHPFASVTVHHGSLRVRYAVATSPDAEESSQLDRDSSLSPLVSESGGALRFEQGIHQSIGAEQHSGTWSTGVTYFHDQMNHPVVSGGVAVEHGTTMLAAADAGSGNLLYDPASQQIAVSGESYAGSGVLAFARDQLSPGTWISLRYAVGQALAMEENQASANLAALVDQMRPGMATMMAASIGSTSHHAGTEWRASYRWQPSSTLTQVDPYDSSSPEAYLSLHFRQPIHYRRLGSHDMQAMVDVQNLLAQGYRPFLTRDGSMLYFAQAERCVEGGLSFSF